MGWLEYIAHNQDEFWHLVAQHLMITGTVSLLIIIIGVPLGIYITRNKWLEGPVIWIANVGQTIPTIAVFGLVLPFMGIGLKPALFALCLYGILPIIRNTYTGIKSVDPALIESAAGMGMTPSQILMRVEIRLALPVIMAGIRTAVVISVGMAALATFIAAGGLGDLIVRGLSMMDNAVLLAGAIPTAILAVLADIILGMAEHAMIPRGIR
ncbi:carnitine transport permease protein OpuCD [Peptococcaceae bacterium CEB3]|nr:carnitine transport permease protein OpuCD [Peptococcaceae bacterium CEB3]